MISNILLVGNGFDLAHGLMTSYNDFLFLMKYWDKFIDRYTIVNSDEESITSDVFKKYLCNDLDNSNIEKLGNIFKHNSWVKYYINCGAEIDGWIDFEKEMVPVISLFDKMLNKENILTNSELYEVAQLFNNYFEIINGTVIIEEKYKYRISGILKKKIVNDLKKEFEDFIHAFEIYFMEFVNKKKDIKVLKQIKQIEAKYCISFNYTLTEEIYGITKDYVHHIHGKISENDQEKNNMVLGVEDREDINIDLVYFKKYFQRINKASGVRYKKFIENDLVIVGDGFDSNNYNLHIYGHSLDQTDEDILKNIISNADSVIIYYYDDEDYARKIINLIKLYGRRNVEENLEGGFWKFVLTNTESI